MSMEQIKAYELQVQERLNSMGFATGGLPAGNGHPGAVGEIESAQQLHTPSVVREVNDDEQLHTPEMAHRKNSNTAMGSKK